MAKHCRTPSDEPLRKGAAENAGTTYWSVADCRWPVVRPTLPWDMVDLLAPPIVVGVARVVATSRLTPQAGPGATRLTPPVAGTTRRPVPSPGPTGRHRRANGPAERNG